MTGAGGNTTLLASLPMYQREPLVGAHDNYWSLIRERLQAAGQAAPDKLDQQIVGIDAWLNDGLVFSQTCGMPYRHHLHGKVHLVGTPDFDLPDCEPGYYRSRYVVRRDDSRDSLAAFSGSVLAFNNTLSQSGYAAPLVHGKQQGIDWRNCLESGAHRQSAQMVRDAKADIAAIDAVTWRLIERYDNWSEQLRVLASTPATPGLPYICARAVDARLVADAVADAIALLSPPDRQALGLHGLVQIDAADYLKVPSPS